MNLHHSEVEAVVGLHQKGFIHDFQFNGTNLLWIQEKISIKAGDFSMLEVHEFSDNGKDQNVSVIYGVLATEHNIKGILIDHFIRP
jgi:hypothetical protein